LTASIVPTAAVIRSAITSGGRCPATTSDSCANTGSGEHQSVERNVVLQEGREVAGLRCRGQPDDQPGEFAALLGRGVLRSEGGGDRFDGLSARDLALIVIAITGGATVLSHVNDSGFWLVGRFLGMDVKTTLRTWTVMETLPGGIGFAFAFALSLVL
jgi:hypothetical protein